MEIENFDEHNALLVIGNGFDLDLGLKTSYDGVIIGKSLRTRLMFFDLIKLKR